MRTIMAMVFAMILVGWGSGVRADVDLGISVDDGGIREFHMAVGDFYGYPEREVVVVRQRNIPDDELPVVFFLSSRARVAPDIIISLRLGGKSWLDITHQYNMGAEIFYVPAPVVSGPPYGRALGYYKNQPREKWKSIKLNDADVVNLVNLQFVSKHYGCSYDDIIKVRSEGKGFVAINHDAKSGKIKKNDRSEKSDKQKSNGKNDKTVKTKQKSKKK